MSDVTLHLGDCLEVMRSMPDKSVDAVITDPPYGTQDGMAARSIKRGKEIVKFDSGEWDKTLPLEWLVDGMRVLIDGKWVAVFTDNLSVKTIWDAINNNGGRSKNTFYWIKTNKAPTPRKNFKSNVESAIVATKGAVQTWYGGGNSPNYIEMPFVSGKDAGLHPTQKPVKLMRHFIELFTKEGDTILDPFMGSGTTGVACVQTGRNFIGIEIDTDYFAIAERRIKEAQAHVPLPFGGTQ